MLNDGLLADVGLIDPATAMVVGTVVSKIVNFGPTREFQQRQAYRDAGAEILSKLKALIPSLPEWIQQTVTDDREEFRQKMIRPNMKVADYKAAIAWIQGREAAWQVMAPPGARVPSEDVPIAPARVIFKNGVPAVTSILPSAGVAPAPSSGVAFQEAGFNLPMMLVVGGVLAWLLLGRK